MRPDIRSDVLARLIEAAAISVLLEAAATGIDDAEGRRLVMLAVLATAGLSWQDSAALIASAPELAAPEATGRGVRRMRVELRGASKGRNAQALAPTTIGFESGRATLARAETEQRPTVLGLLASGRMRPDSRHRHDRRASGCRHDPPHASPSSTRPACATPPPTSPSPASPPRSSCSPASRRTRSRSSRWLDELGLRDLARVPIANVDPSARLRLLTELAVLRDGVEGLVLVAPDRHGGDPQRLVGARAGDSPTVVSPCS